MTRSSPFLGNGAGTVISMTVLERLMAMIWPQKFVRLRSQVVTRFPRHVWDPQKFALKLRDVQKKLRDVQRKLRAVKNEQNRPERLQVQPSVPLVPIPIMSDRLLFVTTYYYLE